MNYTDQILFFNPRKNRVAEREGDRKKMPENGDYLRDICEWSGESMSATPFTFLG
jgi:hypothetical protein